MDGSVVFAKSLQADRQTTRLQYAAPG